MIRFYSPVTDDSVMKLFNVVDQKIKEGTKRIVLLISSQGGSVFAGLSAYHYLKGIPAEIVTHNFGEVDSIAAVIYCAGSKRYSVPEGRFLLHGISSTFAGGMPFEEGLIQQQLKIMQQQGNGIAVVISETTKKPIAEIQAAIEKKTVLSSTEAQKWGLVQEIQSKLYEEGSDLVPIVELPTGAAGPQIATAMPLETRYTTDALVFFTRPLPIFTVPENFSTHRPGPQFLTKPGL